MAWNEAFKTVIKKYIVSKDVQYYALVYALVVSLIATVFVMLTRKSNVKKTTFVM